VFLINIPYNSVDFHYKYFYDIGYSTRQSKACFSDFQILNLATLCQFRRYSLSSYTM